MTSHDPTQSDSTHTLDRAIGTSESRVALLADGALRVPVQATYDLAQAPQALTTLAASHTQDKIAVRIG